MALMECLGVRDILERNQALSADRKILRLNRGLIEMPCDIFAINSNFPIIASMKVDL